MSDSGRTTQARAAARVVVVDDHPFFRDGLIRGLRQSGQLEVVGEAGDGREGLDAKTLAYLPVRFSGQLLGMMQLINRDHERGFSASDIAVLSYVTAQLAEFLATRRSLMG